MADLDLGALSLAELKALQRRIGREIERRSAQDERERKVKAIAAVEGVLHRFGLTIEDVSQVPPSRRAGVKPPPKYRDPGNDANTWSGRGSPPRWFREAVEAGTPAESMAVQAG